MSRPLPPDCRCGRADGAAPIHTRRPNCSIEDAFHETGDDVPGWAVGALVTFVLLVVLMATYLIMGGR